MAQFLFGIIQFFGGVKKEKVNTDVISRASFLVLFKVLNSLF